MRNAVDKHGSIFITHQTQPNSGYDIFYAFDVNVYTVYHIQNM